MAMSIVDQLEPVEVNVAQERLVAVALGAGDQPVQGLMKASAIEDTCQLVRDCQLFQTFDALGLIDNLLLCGRCDGENLLK